MENYSETGQTSSMYSTSVQLRILELHEFQHRIAKITETMEIHQSQQKPRVSSFLPVEDRLERLVV